MPDTTPTPQNRRSFFKQAAGLATAFSLPSLPLAAQIKPIPEVRVGIIGVGSRGFGHVRDLISLPAVQLKAVGDIVPSFVERVQNAAEKAGKVRPVGFSRGENDFKRLCAQPDLDAIYIATPWEWHVKMCVEAMKNGKHAFVEVPAATTIEECWELVETSQATGKYCIMLENCNYDRVELMVLNMVRKGLLGEILAAECGYLHDLRAIKFADRSEGLWRLNHALKRNADLYPTHGLGPVAQCLNVNRGNLFDHMVSMATKSVGLKEYAAKKFGEGSPRAQLDYAQGDVITSLIRTRAGQTITVVHSTNSPRPYSRKYMLQGSRGIIQKYPDPLIYIEGKGRNDQWQKLFENYAAEWEHPLWTQLQEKAKGAGHGGMDFVLNYRLMHCLQKGSAPDMDVYDAVALSAVTELSEKSIAAHSRTMDFPDFTRGAWSKREPLGIVTI